MEGQRFDRLTRMTQANTPRRTLLAAMIAGVVGLPAALDANAKKKKKKRKKNRNKGQTPPPPPPPAAACAEGQKLCRGSCIPSNQCCVDADCAALAPRCCQGTCIRPTECCLNGDCEAGKICQAAACVCAAGAKQCGETCCLAPSDVLAKVTCGTAPDPTCICTVNLAEVCSGDCPSASRALSCTNPGICELIGNLCQEAGCDPPAC